KALKFSPNSWLSEPICVVLQFSSLSTRRKRWISRQKRVTTPGVLSITTLTFPDSTANDVDANAFAALMNNGISQLSADEKSLIVGSIQVSKTLVIATCETSASTCSYHATCTNVLTGYRCTCNAFFIERKDTTPGTICDLHPGTIAFIVIGSLFVIALIAVLVYAIVRYSRKQPICPLCPMDDGVLFEVK
ncbi:hypothetical protein FBUS_06137, partial [Fasciolopsis buskii]